MTTQKEARPSKEAPGRGYRYNSHSYFTAPQHKRQPPFSKQFRFSEQRTALVCIGWPPVRPPARHVLALPPGERPDRFDWSLLRGGYVFCTPPPDGLADPEVLRELGAELAAAGVASLTIFDGVSVLADWWRAGRPGVSP